MPISKPIEPIKITPELQVRRDILTNVKDNLASLNTDTSVPLSVKEKFYIAMELFYEKFLKDTPNLEQDLDNKISKFLNNKLI